MDPRSPEIGSAGRVAQCTSRDAAEVALLLSEIGWLLGLEGDRFRALAYRRAARSVAEEPRFHELLAEGRLAELPGIGAALARVIAELASRGTIPMLERLRARWPRFIAELAALRGVGPRRARQIHAALAPRSMEEILALCEAGRLRTVRGFGPLSEARVRDAIRTRHEHGDTMIASEARRLTEQLARTLRSVDAVHAVAACGPARRWVEVVDRIALAVSTDAPDAVRARFGAHPLVHSARVVGPHLALARTASGTICELHTAPPERFGTATILATGSEAHVEALRRRALERGVAIEDLAAGDEAALYAHVGLPWLPPEVRDGSDEIAAAGADDDFCDLIGLADLTGAVHCHTTYSDGKHSIAEMAAAAEARGLQFLTITDHSQSAAYAGGLTIERLREQWDEIERVQRESPVRLLRGTESDILVDGALDYPDDVLARLDVVIASIHRRHKLDAEAMTRRLETAMRQPLFKIWGHALGRLLLHREPIACRFDAILDAICASPAAIEINGDPHRLDLDPAHARIARERGARFVLSTDAHSIRGLDNLSGAVGIARRARIRKRDVLNALPAEEFAHAVRPERPRA